MLTLFSVPKPFDGRIGDIQRNALLSWRGIRSDVEVILVGDETGVAEAAASAGVGHIGGLATTAQGTPLLDDAFARVDALSRTNLRCFVNADVVMHPSLLPAVQAVAKGDGAFLLVGQTRELAIESGDLNPDELRRRALSEGRLRGPAAIDWFVFPAGLFDPVPPFAVGRAAFDNWMIWRARQVGPVIDATDAVIAIHQPHGYEHLTGGKDEAYYGAEAEENLRLAGGKRRRYTLHDASHRLGPDLRISRQYGSVLRWRETARKVAWKLGKR